VSPEDSLSSIGHLTLAEICRVLEEPSQGLLGRVVRGLREAKKVPDPKRVGKIKKMGLLDLAYEVADSLKRQLPAEFEKAGGPKCVASDKDIRRIEVGEKPLSPRLVAAIVDALEANLMDAGLVWEAAGWGGLDWTVRQIKHDPMHPIYQEVLVAVLAEVQDDLGDGNGLNLLDDDAVVAALDYLRPRDGAAPGSRSAFADEFALDAFALDAFALDARTTLRQARDVFAVKVRAELRADLRADLRIALEFWLILRQRTPQHVGQAQAHTQIVPSPSHQHTALDSASTHS
jgi:hypothetical protein